MTAPHVELDERVRAALGALGALGPGGRPGRDPGWERAFDAAAASRHLDLQARRMRARGQGHYTIGSAGHEANALVAGAVRPSDPALLHYRSGAFFVARLLQDGRPLREAIADVLLSMMGAVADPASGGRHKVFGHPDLAIIPQTSTIASQLPRAVGVAFAIDRARRIGVPTRWPSDSIAVTSFGDASLNHSTAVGALNTAGYCVHTGLALPLLLVCEDNGLGISVPSPSGWVEAAARRPGIRYASADSAAPQELAAVADELVAYVRSARRPALLHLRTVRYLGHAGSDVETTYRSAAALRSEFERDPVLALAAQVGASAAVRYDEIGRLVQTLADELQSAERLTSAAAVMAPLAPRAASEPTGVVVAADPGIASGPARTLAQAINAALAEALERYPNALVFGEDVGRKGGVYGVTRGLAGRYRSSRVFDTLLDEQAILGLGLGLGVSGLLPIPEIQYLAYLHNAEDQLRGEAASLRFFSNGAFTNPMVVRVAGFAYQKGFGGHFHNDDAVAVLRDIPGLAVAVPSHPSDAPAMLRGCLDAAVRNGQVSVFLEPIALYHERDLHEPGDQGWLGTDTAGEVAAVGTGRTHGDGADLTMITFGNGVRMSRRVAARLSADGVAARVLDLRWIAPLPLADILREAEATGRVLVVDETRHSGGVGEGVVTALVEAAFTGRITRVCSADSFIPLGRAADLVLLSEDQIETAARAMVDAGPDRPRRSVTGTGDT